ncbi:MAG: HNH endonuclease signature motif containing protein [Lachnospiraceae bacterium]
MIKGVKNYEDLYGVDEQGNVWSYRNNLILKPYVNTGGYLRVNLCRRGKLKHKYVHRLVAEAFLPNPRDHKVVNHINADPQDNRVENLEWCSQDYNIRHSRSLGNQNDIPVRAFSPITGETKEFRNLKDAGIELFGKWWALRYHQQKYGGHFSKGQWVFEVTKDGV